jgi:hypothetical protein
MCKYINGIMKSFKTVLKGEMEIIKSNRGGEFDQSTFYIYI